MGTDHSKRKMFIYVTAFSAAMAGLLFGYDTGVISGAILFIRDQFQLTAASQEFVVSAVLLGAMFGAAFSGSMADGLGRKGSVIVTAIMFSVGALGSALAPNVLSIAACRFLIGLAIGVASYVAPLYISEIAPASMRGGLVSLNQLMITLGIVVSYVVDYLLSMGANEWRWMFGLGILPGIALLLAMIFLPQSPRWLLIRGKIERARVILVKIYGEAEVDVAMTEISRTVTSDKGRWGDLAKPWVMPALGVGVIMMFFQQMTGINTIIYYAPTIFEFAGFQSHSVSILATIGVGMVNVLMTVVAIWLIDRVGRKPLLYWGMAGMALSLTVLGIAFNAEALSPNLKFIAVGSVVLYIASFAVSLGPICWLIISEIYPLNVRGRAMSIATLSNWAFNLVVASTFLTLIQKLGKAGTFWLYAGLCIAGLLYTRFFVPETKGLSLENIESYLRAGKPIGRLGR
ncbi:MAG: sugar porter family MFS transporter [Candidatus Omnitrophica bacterium]|nr:sugar porter family MFS transporter [Candidatus Omnitrophota bacterium]